MKIYNGIKFKSNDMQEIIKSLYDIREQAIKNSVEYAKSHPDDFVFTMVDNIDDAFKLNIDDFKTNRECQKKVQASLEKRWRTSKDPNFLFNVTIIPWDGEYYGCVYDDQISENHALLKDIADDFYYQNQTDQPEDISDEEWQNRSQIWNDIFDVYFTPGEAGPTYEIVKSDDFNDIKYPNLLKDIVENFRQKFIMGIKGIIKIKPDAENALKDADLLHKLYELSPENIGVEDFMWYSQFPSLNIYMRSNDEFLLVQQMLEPYEEYFEDVKFDTTYIRLSCLQRVLEI